MSTSVSEAPTAETGKPHLTQAVGARQFFNIGFGSIVGVGWIVVLGEWLNQAGPAGAILAFLLGGVLITLLGLCYAEVGTVLPAAGGEMLYAYEAFGLGASYITGWAVTLFTIIVVAYVNISAAWILEYLIPGISGPVLYTFRGGPISVGGLAVALGSTGVITYFNYRGIRSSTAFQDWTTYLKLAAAAVFIVAGLAVARSGNWQPAFQSSNGWTEAQGILAVAVTTLWFYGGFNFVPQMMEEKAPGTPAVMVGRMLLLSIAVAAAFYCLVILSAAGVVPWRSLVHAELPAAAAFNGAFGGRFLSNIVLVTGLLGIFTVGNGTFLAATRLLFAMSRARIVPPVFAELHPRYGSPVKAVYFVGLVAAAVAFLGRKSIIPIINVGSTGLGIGYLMTCLAAIQLRRKRPDLERPFRIPGGSITAGVAAVVTLFLLGSSIYEPYASAHRVPLEWYAMAAWVILGCVLWVAARGARATVSEDERRRLIMGQGLLAETGEDSTTAAIAVTG